MSHSFGLLMTAPLLLLLMSQPAAAQSLNDRYQNRKPGLSPYLSLLQDSRGGLPSYYAFVRPLQRQQELFQQRIQDASARGRMTMSGSAQQRIEIGVPPAEQLRTSGTGTRSEFMVPGAFQSYSHFYSSGAGNRRRRR